MPSLELPDKPSIAVLPFKNMSGDPEQEYFSDGITDDIIVELSRYRELFVIARNSTFAYKGGAANVKQVAAELGVRYVLEGGIRKDGKRVRITAELIEAATGRHLWAERYDRELDDIFAVQDEVARVIVGALGAKLQETDIDRAERKDTDNLDAYDRVLRAHAAYSRFTKADNADARRLCQSAIDLDPGYARAYARLALTYTQDRFSGWADDTAEWLKRAHEAARKAVSLDESDYHGHLSLGICDMVMGRHDQAVTELRRAIELNQNFADSHVQLGNVLAYAGRAEEAATATETAMRLNPLYPPYYLMILGRAHFVRRHYQEALPPLERAVIASPGLTQARAVLAACYAALGRDDDARAEIEEFRDSNPDFTVNYVAKVISYKNPGDLDHHLDLLRKAGLPE
jgi:TolB-like protein/Flp pilus assembly protein TadD